MNRRYIARRKQSRKKTTPHIRKSDGMWVCSDRRYNPRINVFATTKELAYSGCIKEMRLHER